MAEHDAATGALLREYVWLDTMPLAMVTGTVSTPTYTWITTGNLNEPLLLTNAAGQVTASTTRDPWGNPILLAGGAPLDLGYPGQWKDPATGLFQNWHRDYDPTLGRYAQADPLGLGGGSNLFAYVGGDPVNMIDPDGRNPVGAGLVGGAVLAACLRSPKACATLISSAIELTRRSLAPPALPLPRPVPGSGDCSDNDDPNGCELERRLEEKYCKRKFGSHREQFGRCMGRAIINWDLCNRGRPGLPYWTDEMEDGFKFPKPPKKKKRRF